MCVFRRPTKEAKRYLVTQNGTWSHKNGTWSHKTILGHTKLFWSHKMGPVISYIYTLFGTSDMDRTYTHIRHPKRFIILMDVHEYTHVSHMIAHPFAITHDRKWMYIRMYIRMYMRMRTMPYLYTLFSAKEPYN